MVERQFEQIAVDIQSMDRQALVASLLAMRSAVPLDFSRDYLQKLPDERLRHLLLAAHLHAAKQ